MKIRTSPQRKANRAAVLLFICFTGIWILSTIAGPCPPETAQEKHRYGKKEHMPVWTEPYPAPTAAPCDLSRAFYRLFLCGQAPTICRQNRTALADLTVPPASIGQDAYRLTSWRIMFSSALNSTGLTRKCSTPSSWTSGSTCWPNPVITTTCTEGKFLRTC